MEDEDKEQWSKKKDSSWLNTYRQQNVKMQEFMNRRHRAMWEELQKAKKQAARTKSCIIL